ncbi:cobalamin biosynthesis protein CobT, partial [Oxalobacteraceae bacterium GrIS 1.11]
METTMKQTTTKLSKALSALPFAHLLGMSAAHAEDDEMKQGADESDEDFAKRMEEKDEQEKENDAKKAEEDKKEAGEEEDEAGDEKKGKKAKRAEEAGDDKEKAARTSERARCAAIFKCDAA